MTGINAQAAGGPPPRTLIVYEQTVSTSQKVVNNVFNGILVFRSGPEVII